MLEALRKYSGSFVVKLLFVILILSFGVWGIADVFRPQGGRDWAIRVGDVTIPPDQVREDYQRELRRLRQAVGDSVNAETARAFGLPNQVIGNIVSRTLLDLEGNRLHLIVGDEAVRAAVEADPTFKGPSGNFDPDLFKRVLQLNGLTEDGFVELVRGDIARRNLVSAITSGAVVPETIVDAIFRLREQKRVVDYAFAPNDGVGDVGEPDATQVQAFYDAHPDQFSAPEYRAATAVVLSAPAVAKTLTLSDQEIEEAYKARQAEFTEPERRTIEQVLVGDEATAAQVRERLVGGADVAAVAGDFADKGATSVKLDQVSRGQLPDELGDAAFALAVGEVSQPLHSPLGWHVLRVVAIAPGREKSLAEVRDQLKTELTQEKAVDEVYALSTRLEDALGGGAALEEAAKTLGLDPVRVEAIDAAGKDRSGTPVAGLPEDFAKTVFATAEGTESVLTESGRDSFFVVRVDKVIPAGVKPLADVRDAVVAAWKAEQRSQRAKEQAVRIAEAARAGSPLAAAAEKEGLRVQTTPAFTRAGAEHAADVPAALAADAFAASPNEATVVPAADGTYVLRVTSVIEADPSVQPAAVDAIRRDLDLEAQEDTLAQFSAGVRRDFPVTMNPAALESLF